MRRFVWDVQIWAAKDPITTERLEEGAEGVRAAREKTGFQGKEKKEEAGAKPCVEDTRGTLVWERVKVAGGPLLLQEPLFFQLLFLTSSETTSTARRQKGSCWNA